MATFAPKPTYNPTTSALVPNQTLSVGASPLSFAAFNANTNLVCIEVKTANVFATFDNSVPSFTNGVTLYAGQDYHWDVYTASSAKFVYTIAPTSAVLTAVELQASVGDTIPATDLIKPAPQGSGVGTFSSITVSGTTILTGALTLGNAYVGGAPAATGYVTLKDNTGTTYKVLVST